MTDIDNTRDKNQNNLIGRIEQLEKRLSRLEVALRMEWDTGDKESVVSHKEKEDSAENTESTVVEYGLAWLGSIVFLFGIIFLKSYIDNIGYPILSNGIAYVAAFLLILVAYKQENSFPTLSNVLNICFPLLLFYITVELHYFSPEPLISGAGIVLALLLTITAYQFYNSIQKKSEFHGFIALTFGIITAILADSAYITFTILTLCALAAHLLYYYKIWWRLEIYAIIMVYLTHLLWFLGNPLVGNQTGIVESSEHNILFLFAYGIIFSLSIFIPKEKLESNISLVTISLWNALLFSGMILLISQAFYQETYAYIFSAIAAYCILFAVYLKLKSQRLFAPATYASFGFMAFSIAIYGFAGFPNTYFLLVLQSLLVVSMALWFRSKIIVIANSGLYFIILLLFLLFSESINFINFTFVMAAFATARILGWQKERLTLQTDFVRNAYLIAASILILYSLNQALPSQYVTFSWTATSILLFLLSILLKNIKYRYLSIFAFVVTGARLFFIDLGQLSVGYRVIAFLVFAIISIGVSVYYTKKIRKRA